jgi:hypothetical protein
MTSAQFEHRVLKMIEPHLVPGSRAEWFNGTLFVEGVVPDEAQIILDDLKKLDPRIAMSRFGSYQTDYTFAYDFVS